MNQEELTIRCQQIMLTLDVPVHENAALNAGVELADLLAELIKLPESDKDAAAPD